MQLYAAAHRAQATAEQATADRLRLEGDEDGARRHEARSDAELTSARINHSHYTRLILGRGAGAVLTGGNRD